MTKSERSVKNRKRHYNRLFNSMMDEEDTVLVIYPGEDTCGWADIYRDVYGGTGYAVSRSPLISLGYAGCNGVALISTTHGGLSHYNLDLGLCEEHTSKFIEEFLNKNKSGLCKAVLIGGNRSHAELNRCILKEANISVIGAYVDGYGLENRATLERERAPAKDVLVLPQRQEVLIRIRMDSYNPANEDICESYAYLSFKIGRKARGFL